MNQELKPLTPTEIPNHVAKLQKKHEGLLERHAIMLNIHETEEDRKLEQAEIEKALTDLREEIKAARIEIEKIKQESGVSENEQELQEAVKEAGEKLEELEGSVMEMVEGKDLGSLFEEKIVPLLNILCPEGVSKEEYAQEQFEDLFERMMQLHGQNIKKPMTPEEMIEKMKDYLASTFSENTYKFYQENKDYSLLDLAYIDKDGKWRFDQGVERFRSYKNSEESRNYILASLLESSDQQSKRSLLEACEIAGNNRVNFEDLKTCIDKFGAYAVYKLIFHSSFSNGKNVWPTMMSFFSKMDKLENVELCRNLCGDLFRYAYNPEPERIASFFNYFNKFGEAGVNEIIKMDGLQGYHPGLMEILLPVDANTKEKILDLSYAYLRNNIFYELVKSSGVQQALKLCQPRQYIASGNSVILQQLIELPDLESQNNYIALCDTFFKRDFARDDLGFLNGNYYEEKMPEIFGDFFTFFKKLGAKRTEEVLNACDFGYNQHFIIKNLLTLEEPQFTEYLKLCSTIHNYGESPYFSSAFIEVLKKDGALKTEKMFNKYYFRYKEWDEILKKLLLIETDELGEQYLEVLDQMRDSNGVFLSPRLNETILLDNVFECLISFGKEETEELVKDCVRFQSDGKYAYYFPEFLGTILKLKNKDDRDKLKTYTQKDFDFYYDYISKNDPLEFITTFEKLEFERRGRSDIWDLLGLEGDKKREGYAELLDIINKPYTRKTEFLNYYNTYGFEQAKHISERLGNKYNGKWVDIFTMLPVVTATESPEIATQELHDRFLDVYFGFTTSKEGSDSNIPVTVVKDFFNEFGYEHAMRISSSYDFTYQWYNVLAGISDIKDKQKQIEFLDIFNLLESKIHFGALKKCFTELGNKQIQRVVNLVGLESVDSSLFDALLKGLDMEKQDQLCQIKKLHPGLDAHIIVQAIELFGYERADNLFEEYDFNKKRSDGKSGKSRWLEILKLLEGRGGVENQNQFLEVCESAQHQEVEYITIADFFDKYGYKRTKELFIKYDFGGNWSPIFEKIMDMKSIEQQDEFMELGVELGNKNFSSLLYSSYYEINGIDRTRKIFSQNPDITNWDVLIPKLVKMEESNHDVFLRIFNRIESTPVPELTRVKSEVIELLVQSKNPVSDFEKIEQVFVKNNTPSFVKAYQVFNIIHNDQNLSAKLSGSKSTVLNSLSEKLPEARELLLKDLAKVHLETGNSQLYNFAKLFESSEELVKKAETHGWQILSYDEMVTLTHFFKKTLSTALQTPSSPEEIFNKSEMVVDEIPIDELHKSFLEAFDTETISEAFTKYFFGPLGVTSFSEVIHKMNQVQKNSEERRLDFIQNNKITFEEGDLLKGFGSQYFDSVLDNGSLCKEFLGPGAGSDSTPLDTDMAKILDSKTVGNSLNIASGYGDIIMLVKNRDSFNDNYDGFAENKVGKEQWCIRTGFPSSEIDALIVDKSLDKKSLFALAEKVASKGGYIPLIDREGNILFSKEEFDSIKKSYAGVERYFADDIKVNSPQTDKFAEKVSEEILSPEEQNETLQISKKVADTVFRILHECGVTINDSESISLVGCQLMESGSTSRGTGLEKDYDFDFIARLDFNDYKRRSKIVESVKEKTVLDKNAKIEHYKDGDFEQLRLFKIKEMNGVVFPVPIDIDIAFSSRTKPLLFTSHDAVAERFDNIEKNYGKETLEQVKANIKLAKKMLKEHGVYKKNDGYFGGIAVENWILQNNGNFIDAIDSLLAKCEKSGQIIPVGEFKTVYPIIDPGFNLKMANNAEKDSHRDNFAFMIKDQNNFNKFIGALKEIRASLV